MTISPGGLLPQTVVEQDSVESLNDKIIIIIIIFFFIIIINGMLIDYFFAVYSN